MTPQIILCLAVYLYIIGFRSQYEFAMLMYEAEGLNEDASGLDQSRRSSLMIAAIWPIMPVLDLIHAILRLLWPR